MVFPPAVVILMPATAGSGEAVDDEAAHGAGPGGDGEPEAAEPAPVPFSSMIGALAQPGCFWASRTITVLIVGSADVGLMVAMPPLK